MSNINNVDTKAEADLLERFTDKQLTDWVVYQLEHAPRYRLVLEKKPLYNLKDLEDKS